MVLSSLMECFSQMREWFWTDLPRALQVVDKSYFRRPSALPSLLEHAASRNRASGPAFWGQFLSWILTRFGSTFGDELNEQAILPTGDTEVSRPNSRVFFKPLRAPDKGRPQTIDDEGDELAAIDESVALLLRFFDHSVIQVRSGIGRGYGPLALNSPPCRAAGWSGGPDKRTL